MGEDAPQGKPGPSRSSSVKKTRRRRHSRGKEESSSRRGSRKSKKASGGVEEKSLTSETVEECGEYGPRASSPVQRR